MGFLIAPAIAASGMTCFKIGNDWLRRRRYPSARRVYRPLAERIVYRRRRERGMPCADGDLVEVVAHVADGVETGNARAQALVDDDVSHVVAARADLPSEIGAHAAAERR